MSKITYAIFVIFIVAIATGTVYVLSQFPINKTETEIPNILERQGFQIQEVGQQITTTRITDSYPEKPDFEILSADYIDIYLNWTFVRMNETTWNASFTFNRNFWGNVTACNALNGAQRNNCFTDNVINVYLLGVDRTVLIRDINNLTNYPKQKLDNNDVITFGNTIFNMATGSGWFLINIEEFRPGIQMKLGFNSTFIMTVSGSGLAQSNSEKIAKDSLGNLHLIYKDSGNDITYWNSTDNMSTWNTPDELLAGDGSTASILVNSTNGIFAIWVDGGDVKFMNRTLSTNFATTPDIAFDGVSGSITSFNGVSAAFDSNDVLHACVTTSAFNGSSSNQWMLYTNWTQTQGWWGDGTVQNATRSFNGTWVNTSTIDVDHCDMEVDTNNNVYMSTYSSDTWNIDIFSTRNKWQRVTVDDGSGDTESGIAIDPLTNRIYIAFERDANDLGFANNTANNWNGTWTVQTVDSNNSYYPTVEVDQQGRVYIIYENSTSNAKQVVMSNSTVNATAWTVRQVLEDGGGSMWSNLTYPSFQGTVFPTFNRVTDKLYYVYFNDTDNGAYSEVINLSTTGVTAFNLSIESPANTTYTNTSSQYNMSINFTIFNSASKTLDKQWYKLNNTANVTITGNTTIMIDQGWNNITIAMNATDGTYNQTTVFFTYTQTAATCWTCSGTLLIIPTGCLFNVSTGNLFKVCT